MDPPDTDKSPLIGIEPCESRQPRIRLVLQTDVLWKKTGVLWKKKSLQQAVNEDGDIFNHPIKIFLSGELTAIRSPTEEFRLTWLLL